MIMVIILAVGDDREVKALTHSPWGTYTVAFTIPLAIFMNLLALFASGAHRRGVGRGLGIPYFSLLFPADGWRLK